jgi:HemY protein
MMKRLLVYGVLLILLALWGFDIIGPDAGYVLVILGQKTLETSLWFACFLVLAIAIIWWLLRRFVHVSWSLAQNITDFFVFGTAERASKRSASGMIDFLSGDWLHARKKLLRTAAKVESPLVNYLAAARASVELGDQEEALRILNEAQKKHGHNAVPIGVAQARMEMASGRYEQAKIILLALQQKAPRNAIVMSALREVYEVRRDWVALGDLLPQIRKYKVCPVTDIHQMESSVAIGQLELASEFAARAAVVERLAILRKAWGRVPPYQQRVPRVIAAYASALIENLQDQEAEILLRKSLGKSWDDSLAELYGLLRVADLAEAMRTAEGWLKYYPQNAVLLRTLGRLSLRNQLWGVARDYFQRSLAVKKDPETYSELARLLYNLGDTQKSMEVYQAALQVSSPALPDLPQPTKGY